MKCPICKTSECYIIDTRTTPTNMVRRRRRCEKCGAKFTTYEITKEDALMFNRVKRAIEQS